MNGGARRNGGRAPLTSTGAAHRSITLDSEARATSGGRGGGLGCRLPPVKMSIRLTLGPRFFFLESHSDEMAIFRRRPPVGVCVKNALELWAACCVCGHLPAGVFATCTGAGRNGALQWTPEACCPGQETDAPPTVRALPVKGSVCGPRVRPGVGWNPASSAFSL